MRQSVGGGSSTKKLFDEEVDVDSVIGTMAVAQTVSRSPRSAEGSIEIGSRTIARIRDPIAVEAAPPQLSKATWSEHPPAVSIAVDRNYEASLAKKRLVVSHDGEEEGVTTPIQVVHEEMLAQLTMPIPRGNIPAMLHSIAIAAPLKARAKSHAWMGFAMGAAVGIITVIGFAVGIF